MRRAALDNIALYPEFRDCKAPSTERILEIFVTLACHQLHRDGTLIQTFEPELTAQQQQVLDLLGLPREPDHVDPAACQRQVTDDDPESRHVPVRGPGPLHDGSGR